MMKDMEEILEAVWTFSNGILDEISNELAERFINSGQPFVLLHIDKDKNVSFSGITEYDNFGTVLNLSERFGVLTEEMKGMDMGEVFYHDDFGSDGSLVYLEPDGEQTLYQQISEVVDLSAFQCYLCAEKNMEEVVKLPMGSYFMIEVDEIIQKMKDQPKAVQDRQLNKGHR